MYETATPSVVNVWVPVPWPLKVISWLLFALDLVVASLTVLSSTLITKYLVLVDRPPIAVVPSVYVNPSPVFAPWEAMVIVSAPVLTDAGATLNVVAVVWIAMSPACAFSIASLSASDVTEVILNGRKAGIWSMLILPEDVNWTSADGTAFVEYGWLRYGPKLFEI